MGWPASGQSDPWKMIGEEPTPVFCRTGRVSENEVEEPHRMALPRRLG
jgi:hypothetical protein